MDSSTKAKLAETARLELPKAVDLARFEKRAASANAVAAANLKRVRDAGIPIAMGTDAGNPGTLHGAVRLRRDGGHAGRGDDADGGPRRVHEGRRARDGPRDVGTLEKGKRADFLLVGADPLLDVANLRKLNAVVRGGVYRTQAELRAIVAAEK